MHTGTVETIQRECIECRMQLYGVVPYCPYCSSALLWDKEPNRQTAGADRSSKRIEPGVPAPSSSERDTTSKKSEPAVQPREAVIGADSKGASPQAVYQTTEASNAHDDFKQSSETPEAATGENPAAPSGSAVDITVAKPRKRSFGPVIGVAGAVAGVLWLAWPQYADRADPQRPPSSNTKPPALSPNKAGKAPPPSQQVRTPTISRPNVSLGDRWVLQTQDHTNPKWSNTTERRVSDVNSTVMTVASRNTKSNYTRVLSYTRDWNLLSEREPSGSGATYSPAMHYLDFPLAKGKSWHDEVTKRKVDGSEERVFILAANVYDWERIEVPAGTFEAIKVVLEIEIRENGTLLSKSTDTSWYSPVAKRSVKTEELAVDVKTNQESRRTIVLTEYSVSQ